MSIHHVAITVSDPERAEAAFYRCVLAALGFVRQDGTGPATIWRNPASDVAVHMLGVTDMHVHKPADPRAAVDHTAFRAASRGVIDQIHAALAALGAEILGPPRELPQFGPTYYALFARDPDGRLVELVHA
ncbi:MAG: VOC family protein [Rhizobiales bacterium]|nr:VOC family protein [Hyphomicrobiales bacterium]